MAEIHKGSWIRPTKLELVSAWLGSQRWYAAKGATPDLTLLAAWRLGDPAGEVGVETLIVRDTGGPQPIVYQVPLTYRGAPLPGAEGALVGTMEHGVLGDRWVYDGPHDPVYAAQLLALIRGRVRAESSAHSDAFDDRFVGVPAPTWREDLLVRSSRVLSGEQSNTSIILDTTLTDGTPRPVIVKVFRMLAAGDNPDVVLQSALRAAGCERVPAVVGSVRGSWPSLPPTSAPSAGPQRASGAGETAYGHVAFAQEFLPGVEDAWRVASRAVEAGEDFTGPARDLGAATAQVHRALADTLGRVPTTEAAGRALIAGMRARYAEAVTEVEALGRFAPLVDDVLTRAATVAWPPMQRIHGDYHLGQVLHSPERGWILLDFEGEPLRTLAERAQPDQWIRDVAGMLRSFDYCGGSWEHDHPGSARAWVTATQRAFLEGYAAVAGFDPRVHEALLTAFELDKAMYEVVYETRHRPDWVTIPLAAIDRLTGGTGDPVPPAPTEGTTMEVSTEQPKAAPGTAQTAPRGSTTAAPSTKVPTKTVSASKKESTVNPTPTPEVSGAITALVQGRHQQPHDLLGQHVEAGGLRIRVLKPLATSVRVRFEDGVELDLGHEAEGVFSAVRSDVDHTMDYRVLTSWGDGIEHEGDDPYRFAPTLGEVDLHLINEGRHEQLWTVLGAHVQSYPGPMGEVFGTSFAVWAPRAKAVRVIGDFNGWDGRVHPMRLIGSSGIWELFIPGVGAGSIYKYEIRGADDVVRAKADPMAQRTEAPPNTGSVVESSTHEWGDGEWMERRRTTNPHNGPMSVYEVHLGSWRQGMSYRDLAEHLVNYVLDLGFTHVEFLPVMEHPYGPSWGYQVTGYYAPTARFGTPDDFKYLVDILHRNGIGVILDWVPGHFPRDAFALARFDGLALYEHPDPRRGDQPDWGTHIFDFGRREVRNFLVANAIYWLEDFHADGLRVDAVASMLYLDYSRADGEWIPNIHGGREHLEAIGLLQEANATAYKTVPGIVTIAEESTSWPGVTASTDTGGLGFGLKWNMGWMNDWLRYLREQPINRQYHHNLMTFSIMYAFGENYLLPISHDEVVHGKGSLIGKIPGSQPEQLATLRAFLAHMWAQPGKQLIFMGCEFAQTSEWADGRSLDWWLLDSPTHYRVHNLVKELNEFYREHRAMWALDAEPAGFEWLDADDNAGNLFSFLRFGRADRSGDDVVAIVSNYSGEDKEWVRLGVPSGGQWRVALDTSGFDADGRASQAGVVVHAEGGGWHGQPFYVTVRVAALSTLYLVPVIE